MKEAETFITNIVADKLILTARLILLCHSIFQPFQRENPSGERQVKTLTEPHQLLRQLKNLPFLFR